MGSDKPEVKIRTQWRGASTSGGRRSGIQWFFDLPVEQKQLVAVLGSPLLTIVVVLGAREVIRKSTLDNLSKQATSEDAVTRINYNIKINQMGFGFRGQSDNPVIIDAARSHSQGKAISSDRRAQILQILKNEVKVRKIEYATLVGSDLRIIVNANTDRTGEVFNPNGLVAAVLGKDNRQIKSNAIVTWAELQKEKPPLPEGFTNQDALIRYTVTAVRDPETKTLVGALVSGDITNAKFPIVQGTLSVFQGGYSAIYQRNATGTFTLATSLLSQKKGEPEANVSLPQNSLLESAVKDPSKVATDRIRIGNESYTVAAFAEPNLLREEPTGPVVVETNTPPVAILVRGTPETSLVELERVTLNLVIGVIMAAIALAFILSWLFRETIARRIAELQRLTQNFAEGDREARANPRATDEIGKLESTFNQLAEQIVTSELALAQEADRQRQAKESLQQELIQLLGDVEGAASGDLTVRAGLSAGEIGIVADFFNAIIENLREVVTQVKQTAYQVNSSVGINETSIRALSETALGQSAQIIETLRSVESMTQAMQEVAESANQASMVSRSAADTAEAGGTAMERTVSNILSLRETVAGTAKKVKRLGEASQQISKVITLINQIALKTNLLAVNASIEAAKAGEEGRGFAVVAEEVGALAAQSAEATKEIERIVENIQRETSEVVEAMEEGTSQVVEGTRLVEDARQSLRQIVEVSRKVNDLFQHISTSTTSQSKTSLAMRGLIEQIAEISKQTSSSSLEISTSLQETVAIAQKLQASVETFKVEKSR